MTHPEIVTAYHGTHADIAGMPSLDRASNDAERAIFFTDNDEEAAEWSGRRIYEATVDTAGFLVIDYPALHRRMMLGQVAPDRENAYEPEVMINIITAEGRERSWKRAYPFNTHTH